LEQDVENVVVRLLNFVEQNHATDENWYDIPLTQNDPQYSVIDTASVARAKLRSEVRLGGGYLGAFVIGHDLERLPLGEWFQRICLGVDVDMFEDRHGRMCLSMEDPTLTPVMDFTITETMQDTYRPPEKDYSKLANLITVNTIKNLVQTNASVTLRPSAPQEVPPQAQWLTVAEHADDEASIDALGGDPVGVREFHYEDWVTRDFNRNILRVINHAVDGDFAPEAFRHHAFYNEAESRIEMHLVADTAQTVKLGRLGLTVCFEPGEDIWTENSYKFTRPSAEAMLADAGLAIERWLTDPADRFALVVAAPST